MATAKGSALKKSAAKHPEPRPRVGTGSPKAMPVRVEEHAEMSRVELNPTKLEKVILDAIRTSKLGLPDWASVAKNEHISLEYLQQRVDWMRRMGMIK